MSSQRALALGFIYLVAFLAPLKAMAPARAKDGEPTFVLELVLYPQGETLTFEPISLYLTVPYREGELTGTGFIESHLRLHTFTIELSTAGRFLGFPSGEIGGELSGLYFYEQENEYVEHPTEYVSQISGSWHGLLEEDGSGSGNWELSVQGISAGNGYTFEEKTFSGSLVLIPSSFERAALELLAPPVQASEDGLASEEAAASLAGEAQSGMPAGQLPLMWVSALVGSIAGSAMAYVLAFLRPNPMPGSYTPLEQPGSGYGYPHNGHLRPAAEDLADSSSPETLFDSESAEAGSGH